MGLSPTCGLPFKAWWLFTVVVEILISFIVGAIAGWVLLGSQVQFFYSPSPTTYYIERNIRYEAVVTSWIMAVLMSLCIARIISSCALLIGVKKSSPSLSKFWIAFKVFAIMVSLCLVAASFSISLYGKLATCISLFGDLITGYFIRVLYPELDLMRKLIIADPKSRSNDLEGH